MSNEAKSVEKNKIVGQEVFDILSKDQPMQTVGETLDTFGPDFAKFMEKTVEDNKEKYKSPFYILVLTKKDYFMPNLIRNWFISRQTPPHAFNLMEDYTNATKTLYIVDAQKGLCKLLWSLPGLDECFSIARHPLTFAPELVRWIELCFNRKLDLNSYDFDWSESKIA